MEKPMPLLLLLLLLLPLLATLSEGLTLSDSGGGIDVRMRVNVTGYLISLSCEVSGIPGDADDHKIQFHCPVLGGDVACFGDCSPLCAFRDGYCHVMHPLLNSDSVSCQKLLNPPSSKTIRLVIDTRQAALAGAWYCKFRGAVSATAAFGQYLVVTTPQPPPPTSIQLAETTAADRIVGGVDAAAEITSGTEVAGAREGNGSPTVMNVATTRAAPERFGQNGWLGVQPAADDIAERDNNLLRFAKPDYVIGVLTVLGVSLAVNIGFCIRCILARHYIELRRRKQQPPGCLGACLCVSTVQVPEDDVAVAAGGRASSATRDSQYEELQHGSSSKSRLTRSRTLPPGSIAAVAASSAVVSEAGGGSYRALYDPVAGAASGSSRRESPCPPLPPPHPQQHPASLLLLRQNSSTVACRPNYGPAVSANGVSSNSLREESEEATPFLNEAEEAEACSVSSSGAGGGPNARLELSRRMLRKADTLLREANSLLREGGAPGQEA